MLEELGMTGYANSLFCLRPQDKLTHSLHSVSQTVPISPGTHITHSLQVQWPHELEGVYKELS